MNILMLDDDEVDFLLIKRLLKKAFPGDEVNLKWVSDPSSFNITKEIAKYDICFIDQNLGCISGIEIIRVLHENKCLTPLILLTGQDNDEIDQKAVEYGASDFLIKGELTAPLLNRAIRYSFAQKEHEKKLSKLAYIDGLTGLANRTKFDESLEMAIHTTKRSEDYLGLFLIDLDDFKLINDTYGHPAGDALLKEISRRLMKIMRRSDLIARLGGDEFGLLFNGYHNENDILHLKDKVQSVFDKPIEYDGRSFYCKGSFGIAVMDPELDDRKASTLLKAADNALYRAKKNGKNSYEFYDHVLGEAVAKIAKMEQDLKAAIGAGELELYFQPKMSEHGKKIAGAEALLRWNCKSRGMVSPVEFIPIAERTLSILEIGKWVIEEACRKMRIWMDEGINIVPIAVNVSPLQIQTEDFTGHVIKTLEKYNVDPAMLELEITETALIENLPLLKNRMETLSNYGCRWVIDDFGVGYSSLTRLKELPISKIKIDRSFVSQIETSEASHKICSIVILLAHEFNIGLVVEGVERQSQIDKLSILPENELQGFLFSKPVPADEYIEFLLSFPQNSGVYLPEKKRSLT